MKKMTVLVAAGVVVSGAIAGSVSNQKQIVVPAQPVVMTGYEQIVPGDTPKEDRVFPEPVQNPLASFPVLRWTECPSGTHPLVAALTGCTLPDTQVKVIKI